MKTSNNQKFSLPGLEDSDDEMFQDAGPPLGSDPFALNDGMNVQPFASTQEATLPAVAGEFFAMLTHESDFESFMTRILGIFQRAVNATEGSVLELDYKNRCLFFRAVSAGSSPELKTFTVPWGAGVAGRVAETQQIVVLSENDQSGVQLKSIQNQVGFQTHSMAAVPIVIRGRTFCVVEVFNRSGRPHFDERDCAVLNQLAYAAGAVIENRLIFARLSRQNAGKVAA